FIYLMADASLYAESLLNAYYLAMSIYGWAYWLKKKNAEPVPVTKASSKEWLITAAIVFIGWGLMWVVLDRYTDSTVPVWDAWVSATAWAGMWLLARRKIENWLLLNLSNAFAVPLFLMKGLI